MAHVIIHTYSSYTYIYLIYIHSLPFAGNPEGIAHDRRRKSAGSGPHSQGRAGNGLSRTNGRQHDADRHRERGVHHREREREHEFERERARDRNRERDQRQPPSLKQPRVTKDDPEKNNGVLMDLRSPDGGIQERACSFLAFRLQPTAVERFYADGEKKEEEEKKKDVKII